MKKREPIKYMKLSEDSINGAQKGDIEMEKVIEVLKEAMDQKYKVFGIRVCNADENYKIGDEARDSYDWDYLNDCSTYETTKETLGGACATKILVDNYSDDEEIKEALNDAIERAKMYGGFNEYKYTQTVLLGCHPNCDYKYGNDEKEIIIEQADVLYIF